jgi:hypothetical protein
MTRRRRHASIHASVTRVIPPVTRNDHGHPTSSALTADPVLGPGAGHAREHGAPRVRGGPGGGPVGRDARLAAGNARHPDASCGRRPRAGHRGTDLPHRQGRVPGASASGGPRRDLRVLAPPSGSARVTRPDRSRRWSHRGRCMPTSDTVRASRTSWILFGRSVRPHRRVRTTTTTQTRRAFGLQDAMRRAGSRPMPVPRVPHAAGSPARRNHTAEAMTVIHRGPPNPAGATVPGGRRSCDRHQSAPSKAGFRG